jgi:hypothetical protein
VHLLQDGELAAQVPHAWQQLGADGPEAVVDARLPELGLRAEVVVQQRVADAHLAADLADARALEAVAREHAERHPQRVLAVEGGLGVQARPPGLAALVAALGAHARAPLSRRAFTMR